MAPVQYVRVCNAYGKGFFYIPGTQTCLQVSGLARMDVDYTQPFTRGSDAFGFRTRGVVNFDVRTQTEYGTVRAYIRLQSDFSANNAMHSNPTSGPAGVAAAGQVPNQVYVQSAYVQFGGLTAGLAQSFYDYIPFGFYLASLAGDQNSLLVAYSAAFGNGITASIAAEDAHYREQFAGPGPLIAYAGTAMPDIVAALAVKQGWGSAQLSAAVRQLRDLAPAVRTGYGWGVQAGLSINLPMLARGDSIYFIGAYAQGALSYLGGTTGVEGTAGPLGPWKGVFGFSDAYLDAAGTGLDQTRGFQLTGALRHYWTPTLRSALGVIYLAIDGQGIAHDFSQLTVAGNLVWSPVPDLDLGLEVFNEALLHHAAGVIPPATHTAVWGSIARLERRF
ncbi:MAG TPA: porin [Caulobacteraceae bacterium]|nr:porin [Caulobacteraceae bacterium]